MLTHRRPLPSARAERALLLMLVSAALLEVSACSDNNQSGSQVGAARPNQGGSKSVWSDAGTSVGGNLNIGIAGLGNDSEIILDDGSTCAGAEIPIKSIPFDIVLLLDQSTSMEEGIGSGSRWQAVTSAIKAFIEAPEASNLAVGLHYFGLPDPKVAFETSCDPSVYEKPDVEIGSLADASVRASLIASIDKHAPSNFTPTAPALQGALAKAKSWATAHPERPVLVVLATDGQPTECSPSNTVKIASEIVAPAFQAEPSIRTFVIGVGKSLTTLNEIAKQGGTGRAVLVEDTPDTQARVTSALVALSRSHVVCSYDIPTAAKADPKLVNVRLAKPDTDAKLLPFVDGASSCTADGWYYDNPSAPKIINLCPATCENLFDGHLEIVAGCKTVIR